MTSDKKYNNYSRNSSNCISHINNISNNNQPNNNTMTNQRTPFRSTKRPWTPSKETQRAASSSSILPRPDMIKRSTSLPTKLENAPRTKKLFWFRPTIYLPEKENRLDSPVLVQSFPRVDSRDMPLIPTLDDVSETNYNTLEELDELVGLGFLNE